MSTPTDFVYTPLTRVEVGLFALEYGTDYTGPGENPDLPYEHLDVHLADLPDSPPLVARLALLADLASAGMAAAGQPLTPARSAQLQCLVLLPLDSQRLSEAERAQVLDPLNRHLPLGHFVASDSEGFAFRYTLTAAAAEALDPYLVAEVLENARSACLRFWPALQALCSGRSDLKAFLASGAQHV